MPYVNGVYIPTTRTTTENIREWIHDGVDWGYDFAAELYKGKCHDLALVPSIVERQTAWLKSIEREPKRFQASSYGGWPRIWHNVLGIGMAAQWPYWYPRPTVAVHSPIFGAEWIDWMSLTGIEEVRRTE